MLFVKGLIALRRKKCLKKINCAGMKHFSGWSSDSKLKFDKFK